MNTRNESGNSLPIGGQAVIEGVMMRAPGMIATAVRRPSGQIVVNKSPFRSMGERIALFKLPILRGAIGLIEMLIIGIETLNYSAEVAMSNNGAHVKQGNEEETKAERRKERFKLSLTVVASLALGIAIFFLTPLVATTFLFNVDQEPLLFNVTAGLLRIGLLLVYLGIISQSKQIKRLFKYHGAEHKAVFAFEKGEQLTVDAAARQSRFHPRCGTSFLLVVMFSAILLFSILDTVLIAWLGKIDILTRVATHLPLIPLVGGISYEFIKASAKRSDTVIGRLIVAPGLWLQRITTQEPDGDQLEVALIALRCALGEGEEIAVNKSPLMQQEIVLN